jgi:hypothetical protein
MSPPAPTWSTWRELAAVVSAPRQLRKTVAIALIVGTVFFAMNQLSVIISGQATTLIWLKAVLTYATPLLVSSFGIASATRRAPSGTSTQGTAP